MYSYDLNVQVMNSDVINITKAAELLQKGSFRMAKDIYVPLLLRANKIKDENYNIIKQLCNQHLGSIELYNKNYTLAKNFFQEALKYVSSDEDKSFLYKLLGESLMGIGEYKNAEFIFRTISNIKNNLKERDKLLNNVWHARALFHINSLENYNLAVSIIENVIKIDPNNVEALSFISDMAISKGFGKHVISNIIIAIAYSSTYRKDSSKESVQLAKRNFAKLMKDEENKNYCDKINSDMSIYRHMAQVLKEYGAVETSLYLFKRGFNFDLVLNNPKEIVCFTINILGCLEVLNKGQESFLYLKNYYKNYGEMSISHLKNIDIYKIIEIIQDVQSEEYKCYNADIFLIINELNDDKSDIETLKKKEYTDLELEIISLHFTLIKILYSNGCLYFIPQLIRIIDPVAINQDLHLTIIRNQFSYFVYIKLLMKYINYPIPKLKEKIYVCGDSHSLALSWQTINNKLVIPKLITGMKCWHMQESTLFFTKKNFDNIINSIPDKSTVIFIFGEIDCREGILSAYEKCKYATYEEGVRCTANIYLNSLKSLKEKKKFNILIHPVPPVLDITRNMVNIFNDYLSKQKIMDGYMNFHDDLLTEDKEGFNNEYFLDNTHMAPIYKKLLEKYL